METISHLSLEENEAVSAAKEVAELRNHTLVFACIANAVDRSKKTYDVLIIDNSSREHVLSIRSNDFATVADLMLQYVTSIKE